jgi:L-xylulokinase
MGKYLLGTDNGGTVAKAALFALDGREVAAAGCKAEMFSPQPGHFERDMQRLWQATAESIRSVLAASGVSGDEVACVGCTGHGNGLMFDIDACALACGIVDERQMCLVAGTWSINQYISRSPVIDPDLFMCSRYCIPGYYLVPEASATSASNLKWFVTQFLDAPGAPGHPPGKSAYDLVADLVAQTATEDSSIVFLPFLFGSNADPNAKACLIGLGGWHDRGHVLRAIQEGVVFSHRAHVDRLMRFREPAETIRLTGGGARSRQWVQIFADVFQTPVEIPCGTELGALGAAIGAAVAAGLYGDYHEAVRAMVRVAEVREPDATRREVYARKYRRYQAAVAALAGLWNELA